MKVNYDCQVSHRPHHALGCLVTNLRLWSTLPAWVPCVRFKTIQQEHATDHAVDLFLSLPGSMMVLSTVTAYLPPDLINTFPLLQ